MARKTQISREIILNTAFQMLIRDGYNAINITSSTAEESAASSQELSGQATMLSGMVEHFRLRAHQNVG